MMKIALSVPRLVKDISVNVQTINTLISEACTNGAGLVLFPEAALTGLVNNDIYDHDINVAVSVGDKIIADLRNTAKANRIWLCLGFIEKEDGRIYDSAVLINADGEIAIHYRRINPQWRGQKLPANQYAEGVEVKSAITPLGKTAILICGDLFDESVLAMLHAHKPDLLLFPFARCFHSGIIDAQQEWDETEQYEYINQAGRTGATVAMTNYIGTEEIDDTSFGGAFVVNAKGEMTDSLPLYQEGILYFEYSGSIG